MDTNGLDEILELFDKVSHDRDFRVRVSNKILDIFDSAFDKLKDFTEENRDKS
jgi:hypothetical protein